MRLGPRRLHRLEHVEVILVGQFRIHAADHVDLGNRHFGVFPHPLRRLLRLEHIPPLILRLYVEGAELAQFVADIGVVDVLIAHVVGRMTVTCLADKIRQIPQDR